MSEGDQSGDERGRPHPPDDGCDRTAGAPLTRLDPDAPPSRPAPPAPDRPPPAAAAVIDTRRYRWAVGVIGLILVVVISVYQFATHGVGSTGVAPGQRLHSFAAPLAASTLVGDPNLQPPCTAARHDPRALNTCLIVRREPLVISFFVAGSDDCVRQVDALQELSRRYPAGVVRFAAVAVKAGRATTARLVRSRHWTIPVAYDRDGSVGGLYGVAICPMAELAYPGGVVRDRLIGERWQSAAQLAPRVQALVAASRAGRRS